MRFFVYRKDDLRRRRSRVEIGASGFEIGINLRILARIELIVIINRREATHSSLALVILSRDSAPFILFVNFFFFSFLYRN